MQTMGWTVKYFIRTGWPQSPIIMTKRLVLTAAGRSVNHDGPLICPTLHHKITRSRHAASTMPHYSCIHASNFPASPSRQHQIISVTGSWYLFTTMCGLVIMCITWLQTCYLVLLFLISSLKSLQYLRLISVTQIILMSVRIKIISAVC